MSFLSPTSPPSVIETETIVSPFGISISYSLRELRTDYQIRLERRSNLKVFKKDEEYDRIKNIQIEGFEPFSGKK